MVAKEKQQAVVEDAKKESALRVEMQAVAKDPEAKYMGPAKSGGKWFKNHKTGVLYRVDKGENGYEVKETRKQEEVKVKGKVIKRKSETGGPTRQELMELARSKKIKNFRVMNKEELAEVVKESTSKSRAKEIEETAVKRWKSGWKFQDKKKSE